MDETLGCRVISPVSVGAGTTRILNRYGLLNYLWEHEYIQSLATYQTENKVGIDEWNILKSVRTYLAALGTRGTLRRENTVRIKQKHFHQSLKPEHHANTHWFPIQSKWTLEKKADPVITLNMTNTKAATNLANDVWKITRVFLL